MQPKLIIAFERLNNAEFLTKSGTIISGLTENLNYPEPWMPQVASLVELTNALTDYETAYHDALSMDKFKISHRDDCRFILNAMLKKMAPYIELVAQGDVSVLETSGYDLRHDSTHSTPYEPLAPPTEFTVTLGSFSGSVDVKFSSITAAASYEVQITQLDPIVEANWVHALWSKSSQHITVKDLTPGESYWVRVRGLGVNGSGLWTGPVNIRVV